MRTIPSALQAHLDSGVTTTCRLLKVTLRDGTVAGMTTLDQDVTYNGVLYGASTGFNPSVIASDVNYSVDNSEGYALLSGTLQGVTEDMVRRGDLEGATWEMYLINYLDHGMGHVLLDAGDIGEVKLRNGMVWVPELLSYAMRLRQSVGRVDSRRCRAIFGNQTPGQLFCGVDAEALWANGTVSAVDSEEPTRVFAGDTVKEAPARLQWLTGDNASDKVYQVEIGDTGTGNIYIFEPLPFPIQVNDTYKIRDDCNKELATCRDTYDNMLEFKGEPLIPVGEGSTQVPSAEIPLRKVFIGPITHI